MKKKAAKAGKTTKGRKRSAVKDLSARKAGAAKGGVLIGLLVPAVQKVRESSAQKVRLTSITDGTSNTLL